MKITEKQEKVRFEAKKELLIKLGFDITGNSTLNNLKLKNPSKMYYHPVYSLKIDLSAIDPSYYISVLAETIYNTAYSIGQNDLKRKFNNLLMEEKVEKCKSQGFFLNKEE